MAQLKAAPLGLALGFLSVLMANAADLPPPIAYTECMLLPAAFTAAAQPCVEAAAATQNGFYS